MTETVKRVNVTLPVEQVERIQRLAGEHSSEYPSVSAFVADAVSRLLADEEAHHMLLGVLREMGGEPDEGDQAWADEALALARRLTSRSDPDGGRGVT